MKKVYKKPGIYIENFALSQSIATGCKAKEDGGMFGKPALDAKETCAWDMGNVMVWHVGAGTSACEFPGGDEFEGYCYNNPSTGISIFSNS